MSVRRPARWKRPQEPRCHGREEAPLPSAPDRHIGDTQPLGAPSLNRGSVHRCKMRARWPGGSDDEVTLS